MRLPICLCVYMFNAHRFKSACQFNFFIRRRSKSSPHSRRRINPTPVSSLSSSHPAVSSSPSSSLAFAIPEEEAPKQKSYANVTAKRSDPIRTDKQAVHIETGTIVCTEDTPDLHEREKTDPIGLVHPSLVCCVPQLERIGDLYVTFIKSNCWYGWCWWLEWQGIVLLLERWVANVFGEMYFIVQLLTATSVGQTSPLTSETGTYRNTV